MLFLKVLVVVVVATCYCLKKINEGHIMQAFATILLVILVVAGSLLA